MVKLFGLLASVAAFSGVVYSLPSAASIDTWQGLDALLPRNNNGSSNFLNTLSAGQRAVFDQSMSVLDQNFQFPFLFGSSRYTAYYAVSLLARNQPGDVDLATTLFYNAIAAQHKNSTNAWYGAFLDVNQPYPGKLNAPKIYGSYDPNSNLFVATAFMLAIEDFKHLIPKDTLNNIIESGYRAVVGDTYRVFGFESDNLTPAYSNPWLMRCMAMAYYGNLKQDYNMTSYAERYANEFYQLFDLYDTLSEFNSATYTGVSLWALSLAGYLPPNTTMAKRAGDTIAKLWDKTSMLYHPYMNTLGGPWDRTYGFAMNEYVSLLGFYVAALVKDPNQPSTWPLPYKMSGAQHVADGAFAPLVAISSRFHDPYVSSTSKQRLSTLDQPRYVTAKAWSPPFDANLTQYGPRNYSAYLSCNVSVGGTEIDELVIGGPAKSATAFTPAVMLWKTTTGPFNYPQPYVGWMSVYPTSGTISARASETNLTIRLPPSQAFAANYTKPVRMTLLFATTPGVQLPSDFLVQSNSTGQSLPTIQLKLGGNVAAQPRNLTYDSSVNINNFYYYNLTFRLAGLSNNTVPELVVSWSF